MTALDTSPGSRLAARSARIFLAGQQLILNPIGLVGLLIVAALVLVALLAPMLAPHAPDAQNLDLRLIAPGGDHPLGTDQLGRDILSRILHGARITLGIVALVVVIAAPIGLVVGCVAGYHGGWVDVVMMRITDVFLAFPRLILALALVAAMGPGITNAVIAIAVTAWPVYARIARAETLTVRGTDYVSAARLQGASSWRLIRRQIMPACTNSLIVRVTLDMAGIILTAAGLGFLGLGAQPPSPEWGAMIAQGREYLFDQWWIATVPGVAILVVSLGFNLLGDGLRDVLDPRA
ncbi:MAG: ABC transporter permease [Alphaproteobacteria bacterium]|jgi:peptide/nickel transport system permease protein|nr:ABC transporter permease [Alphaproteobacteria bacterium]MDP6517148.1 ABC transporter permease [Alphaproteobacteria bacterium]